MPLDEWGEEITPTEPEQPTENLPENNGESAPSDGDLIIANWNLTEAVEFIRYNAIDNEDFLDSDDDAKVRYLNVSHRTLTRKYPSLVIPLHADHLFATALATAFNDTNKLQQQGVASFSVKGISFTFKDWAKKGLDALIPQEVLDLISDENGVSLKTGVKKRRVTLNGGYSS